MKDYNKYVIMYLRDENRNPWGCLIAFDKYTYGISICNSKDKFSKKIARDLIFNSKNIFNFDSVINDYNSENFPIKSYKIKKYKKLLTKIMFLLVKAQRFYGNKLWKY